MYNSLRTQLFSFSRFCFTSEFEGDAGHYLKDSDGKDIEAKATEPASKQAEGSSTSFTVAFSSVTVLCLVAATLIL